MTSRKTFLKGIAAAGGMGLFGGCRILGDPEVGLTYRGWREGEKGFTALWKMMYDRFVNYHHLDNILWVWNANAPRDIPGDTAKAYELYYPGNEYVDVLATDVYNRDWKQSHHDQLVKLGKGKLIALGELGSLPTPEQLQKMNRFAWFMIWTGFTSDKYNTLDELKAVFEMPNVVNYKHQ